MRVHTNNNNNLRNNKKTVETSLADTGTLISCRMVKDSHSSALEKVLERHETAVLVQNNNNNK